MLKVTHLHSRCCTVINTFAVFLELIQHVTFVSFENPALLFRSEVTKRVSWRVCTLPFSSFWMFPQMYNWESQHVLNLESLQTESFTTIFSHTRSVAIGMAMSAEQSVNQSVYHFGPALNSITVTWIAIKFCTNFHCSQRKNPADFGDPQLPWEWHL